jgi:hypothetical protein
MKKIQYKIVGTGITRALQKATEEQKDLVIMYDTDILGRPVNIGYFLALRGKAIPFNPKVTRFDLNEIELSIDNTNSDVVEPTLGADFHHPRKNERHFLLNISFDEGNRFVLRNMFRLTKGATSGFLIQVELLNLEGQKINLRPVVRYDQSHGFIHRDMIASDGTKTKYKLKTQDVKTAIVFAIDEIRDNLGEWLQQLGYLKPDQQTLKQESVAHEMDEAKARLLELCDNPSKIKDIQSSYFHLGAEPITIQYHY